MFSYVFVLKFYLEVTFRVHFSVDLKHALRKMKQMYRYLYVLNVTLSVHFQLILTNICVSQLPQNFYNTSVRLGGEGRSFSSR